MPTTFNTNIARGLMVGDGFRKLVVGLTGPAAYVTGGEALTPGQFRLGTIEYWPDATLLNAAGTATVTARYDYATGKLQYFGGVAAGVTTYAPTNLDGADAPTAGSDTADQAAAPANSDVIAAQSDNATLLGDVVLAADPDVPRNVTIVLANDSGNPFNLYVGTTTFTITGTFRGAPQVETIAFTIANGEKTVADGKFRFLSGVLPFETITSITYDHTADNPDDLLISVGLGTLLGLPSIPDPLGDAAIQTFTIDTVAQTIAGAFDYTNLTVDVGTQADGVDLVVAYTALGSAVGGAQTEIAADADLSGFTGRVLIHGK